MKKKKTQVCIIGSGPAGLLLSQLLHNEGISSIVIDRQSREHIEARVRAGVLEWGSVEALDEAGIGARMHKEGIPHAGFELAFNGDRHRIDIKGHTGKDVMIYGQTELTVDLIARRLEQAGEIVFSASDVVPLDVKSPSPKVRYCANGENYEIECDHIAGCDGFHGVSKSAIPDDVLKTFERVYPFGWLGLLVDKPPVSEELIYANHERGFALSSMRSKTRSRYYIQCSLNDKVEDWSDQRFWDEFSLRMGPQIAADLQTGDSFEKSIAPLRSFVAEPMRYGNLYLAGDAAHIVPPTGAKGLNLAIADVRVLSRAFVEHYKRNNDAYLDRYSEICLKRVWKVERFSWFMSMMLHHFPNMSAFEKRMQRAEFDHIVGSETASRSVAENYVGLPLEI
ncbi:4-hydroxybenzoate 3-monooxygenase [Ahrensia marina]|uniref:4-hydroxybenzoate 3-monooxygenase n=1 Tax=Ahrensia marina TaxID=1514904 RepID=A0A0N1J6H3_9HYPH|nr:4-hydroxybenzoate 3-monooxygenase [Ahrensia marina]KPB01854.1 4-hydroxybenzoate 3-monooxygenase [Ahrensia marina]